MHKQYTPQEMADRCLIIREVQNVVGKIAQCDLLADYDLVPQFWSSREDICLGMNNGYFKGAEAVKGYYQQKLENTKKLTARVMEKWADHPNVKGKTADEMYGAGYVKGTDMHTPIIEVAEDGKSAKGLWYTPGFINSHASANGQIRSQTLWERYGGDFVLEDGRWLYKNLRVCPDIGGNVGGGGFAYRVRMAPSPEMLKKMAQEMGGGASDIPGMMPKKPGASPAAQALVAPATPGPLFEDWTKFTVPQPVPIPEPYTTDSEIWHYCDNPRLED